MREPANQRSARPCSRPDQAISIRPGRSAVAAPADIAAATTTHLRLVTAAATSENRRRSVTPITAMARVPRSSTA